MAPHACRWVCQCKIHTHCHQKSRFGMANRATCYFEAFKRIEERLDLPASNEYMTSGKIKYAERKTALRYRYGTMWTRKMAYRCGHAPSSKCLLCGDEDGGHHTASGCPALKRMYINRHNKVGRLITTRVLRGRKGAFVIQMDLGSTENCAEDGIMAHQSRNIPWELLPRGLKEAVQLVACKHKAPPISALMVCSTNPRMETTQQSTG